MPFRDHRDSCLLPSLMIAIYTATQLKNARKNIEAALNLFRTLGFTIHDKICSCCNKQTEISWLHIGFWTNYCHPVKGNNFSNQIGLLRSKIEKIVLKKRICAFYWQTRGCLPGRKMGTSALQKLWEVKNTSFERERWQSWSCRYPVRGAEKERDLDWWFANVSTSFFPLNVTPPPVEKQQQIDASSSGGWVAVYCYISTWWKVD